MVKAIFFDMGGVLIDLYLDRCADAFYNVAGLKQIRSILDPWHQRGFLNDAENGQKYAKALSTLVLNFTRFGDPNCQYLPEWKKATLEDNYTMIIDKQCRCVAHYDDELLDLHYQYAPKFVPPFMKKK